ncbi:MAG: cardiolipin synthase [Muribaculaceae bacterium]|nr:cardiolipin synthase [Muribaculaceae bacterium]
MFADYAHMIDWSWVREISFTLYALTIISIIVIVISENRNPVKTLAWVTVLLLLPMVGVILYLFFGRNIKNTHKVSRRLRRQMRRKEAAPKPDTRLMESLQPESVQMMRLGQTLTGGHIYPGNTVEVFTSGQEKFDSLLRDLENARHFIHLEYYIFENDRIGSQVAEILIRRALEGVNVRVIYDHVGSFSVKSKFFKRMRKAGIQVYPFFEVTFPQLGTRINWRNHRKICIIDGRIGYLGGMNIADRYIDGGKKFASWRDTHVRVTGPILAALQHSFAVDWHFMNQPLPADSSKFTTRRTGDIAAQLVTSGPTSQWSNIAYMFHKAIGNARKRIYIQTPYFLPTDALLKGLISAALSKVDVRILIPTKTDSPLLNFASASYIAECLRAGIKIYFYDAGMLHSKLIIVDDELVTIGSTNFDFRSFEHNFEGNLFFYSKDLNRQLTEIYRNDLTHAHRITPQAWRKRPLWRRAVASIVRLLSPIL